MIQHSNRAILARINQRLVFLKLSMRKASLDAGLGADVIRDMERRPEVMPTIETIEKLAPVLQARAEWLAFNVNAMEDSEPQRMRIIGAVAAGNWLDIEGPTDEMMDDAPIAFDPRLPPLSQYALIVRGTSINKIAAPNDILHCVDIGISGLVAADGDLVVVERRRAQSGIKEVTAKRYSMQSRYVELRPESDDPQWRKPIRVPKGIRKEGEEIAVIAIVIGAYRPLRRAWPIAVRNEHEQARGRVVELSRPTNPRVRRL